MSYTEYSCELTNMVMITDPSSGNVLVQNRAISWKGFSFPGGHVEQGESFIGSAIREIKEETGLTVRNLELCGVIHWEDCEKPAKYLVFLYKTSDFSGVLNANDEGELSWVSVDELKNLPLSNNFDKYVNLFLSDRVGEAYSLYGGNHTDEELVVY